MINLNKKYKLVDRDHTYEVELFTIKNGLVFGIQSTLIPDKWISLTCEAELGYVIDKGHTQFRLVEIGPYDHIQVDDPCYFWNEPPQFACPNKIPGHFAGICSNTGRPLMWKDGTTSFTQHGFSKVPMDNCVLNDELGFVIDGRSKGMSY